MNGKIKGIASILLVVGIIAMLFSGIAAAAKNSGEYIGEYKGIIAKSNGPYTGTISGTWQCVDYVKRFYTTLMDTSQWYGFNAIDFYNKASERGLVAYANNGYMPPQPDDILVYSGGVGVGHVAIITAVRANQVDIIEQNVNRETAYATLPRYGNYIPNRVISGVTLYTQGWVRKPAPITVTSPNGFETWWKGNNLLVQWSYIGYPGTQVRIELLRGSTVTQLVPWPYWASIGSNGRGSYSVSRPPLAGAGSNYKIRVTTNYGYTDTSNGYFTLT